MPAERRIAQERPRRPPGLAAGRGNCSRFHGSGCAPAHARYVGNLGYARQVDEILDYVRARYYAPNVGAWDTVDASLADDHAYRYVRGGPVRGVDPSGRKCVSAGVVSPPRMVAYPNVDAGCPRPGFCAAYSLYGTFDTWGPAHEDCHIIQWVTHTECHTGVAPNTTPCEVVTGCKGTPQRIDKLATYVIDSPGENPFYLYVKYPIFKPPVHVQIQWQDQPGTVLRQPCVMFTSRAQYYTDLVDRACILGLKKTCSQLSKAGPNNVDYRRCVASRVAWSVHLALDTTKPIQPDPRLPRANPSVSGSPAPDPANWHGCLN
jgi:RHS repeat-associated protein